MRDRLDHVIYVGKAKDLRKRVGSYFMPSRKFSADLKTRALIDSVWNLEYHIVRSDAEAVLFEGRLIKEFRPKYNISFRDDKRFLLVRVHLAEPMPRFALTRMRKEDGARYFGPFANAGALRSTLEAMRKRFGIRSCRPLEPGEVEYKHCLDHVIKNCSAPCIGKTTREDYLARVESACEFLEGQGREMLGRPTLSRPAGGSAGDQQRKAIRQGEARDIGIQPAKSGFGEMADPGHRQLLPLAFDRVHEVAARIGMRVGSARGNAGPFHPAPDQPAIAR
jgi:excinuclease ABC subunit C